ncbi:Ubiquitin fusion degradation protein 4 [Steccherinum ochraceum]|uniref:HECT-type E3 ubiquitin transferase n=1 Tax=Steccherinum ochraceum TaxID=92696 RepID=A0A4R0RTZ4_9APHY|nr:Ubiquitin fusion degradation protein 4 [Steccherinum ochraceum]
MQTATILGLSVVVLFVLQKWLAFKKIVRDVQDRPGYRTLLSLDGITSFFPPIPYVSVGNTNITDKHRKFEEFNADIYTHVSMWPPSASLIVADAQVVKEIVGSRARFPKPIEIYTALLVFGSNIVASEHDEWKRYRKISGPAFTEPNNRLVWDETVSVMNDLFDNVWGDKKQVTIEHALEITMPLALFVIGAAGFGRRLNWKEELKAPPGHTMTFKDALYTVSDGIVTKIIAPKWLGSISPRIKRTLQAFDELEKYMVEMIESRKGAVTKEQRYDLFSSLLNANDGNADGIKLADRELLGNIFVFLIAGHETTAHTLCFALGLLALFPDEQDKVYEEILKVIPGDKNPTFQDLGALSYVDCVLNETLRMYPPVSYQHDFESHREPVTFVVPKGAGISIHTVGLHNNPKYWDEPEIFKPSRFQGDWPRDAFLPFSGGVRSCLGRRFAELESIVAITMLVKKYKITIKEEPQFAGETFEQRMNRVLATKNGLTLTRQAVTTLATIHDSEHDENDSELNQIITLEGIDGSLQTLNGLHPTEPISRNARVKAKQKEKESANAASSSSATATSSTTTKRAREITSAAKGKGKEVAADELTTRTSKRARRTTYPISAGVTINEPVKDLKGKKRAAPESISDDDTTALTASSSKRTRTTSAYSLRSRTEAQTTVADMPKKSKSTTTAKGKAVANAKAKYAVASSSRHEDEDVEMLDADYMQDEPDEKAVPEAAPALPEDGMEEEHDEDDERDEGDEDEDEGEGEGDKGVDNEDGGAGDEMSLGMFGDYRQLGSYMMGISGRLKTMLNNIKRTADPTTRLVTLQELSELLSISTEDTLAGSFQVEAFVRELVRILGGTGNNDDEGDDDEDQEHDEDAALAAALAMSTGGAYQGDENLEAQVLACRCLANLMEALPGVAHTVVYHGAIPVLCSKLIEISYIDLAEQTLSTLEKISEEFPSSIVREGGLAALLNYLDFFSIAVQRTALQAASNCCRNVSVEHFPMIRGVWPIIRNCLGYSDQRLVEYACLCVIRVVDAYHRHSPENLEALVDADLIQAVILLLLPSGGSPLIAASTFTLLLRALATSARASPKITLVLLEAGVVNTLYQILTGVLPPTSDGLEEQGDADGGQGLGGGVADMTVMENLSHRPKDQVEEALSLISELMPPIPKDGIFDHKGYTEKALSRMVKAKAKAERAAARQAHAAVTNNLAAAGLLIVERPSPAPAAGPSEDSPAPEASGAEGNNDSEEALPASAAPKEPAADRTELLRSKPEVVNRYMHLMVPILVDVYAASVITPVRIKTLTGLLKAVSFLDGEELKRVFTFVPVASFASSIISSKDHPTLIIGAQQLVELLLSKVPSEYKPAFRREGVFHEIEILSSRTLASSKSKDKDKNKETPDATATPEPAAPTYMPISSALAATMPGYKKLSSLSLDPDDAITLRARVIKFKFLSDSDQTGSDDLFAALSRLVSGLSEINASDKDLLSSLVELAGLFSSSDTSVSSFELLQSGVVDGLLHFLTDSERAVSITRRQDLFFEAFNNKKHKGSVSGQTPFVVFVKKLQEALTRMESLEVVTVAQSTDDSKRSSPSLLARQLRLRLVAAEDSDIPRNLSNIIVSIHAIATFQALHDYLRPRVAGIMSGGSRLSGMLAALAASGFAGTSRGIPADAALSASKPPSPPTESNAAASSSSAPAPAESSSLGRRRSQRLSAKAAGQGNGSAEEGPEPDEPSAAAADPAPAPSEPTHPAESAVSDTVVNEDEPEFEAEFSDDDIDVDAEVIDDEGDPDRSTEKTVTVSVGEGELKPLPHSVSETPDGTRVTTPNPAKPSSSAASTSRNPPAAKTSYAAALKTKPSDWHLEFYMDEHQLPLDLTIYGAIHQHEARRKSSGQALSPSMIWQNVYSIKFKKVHGPAPASANRGDDLSTRSRSPGPVLSSLPEDAPTAKTLRLLRVLHKLNSSECERVAPIGPKRTLPETAFVNNKLSAKLTRQLEEPMIVASSCLPDWALDLPQHFPFLFPFATRYNFLQSTSFGYARLILKWQSQQSRSQDSSRRDDGVGFLGRLQRQKVRISRKHILESAMKVFELYGSSSSILEVEYFEEVGTGLGPTLEFYSLVSREFARRDLKIWRDADHTMPGPHVHHPSGLFPAPLLNEDVANDGGQKRSHILRVIGQFVAKAMLDSRIIDLSMNKIFIKLILGEEVALTLDNLRRVDADLAESLLKLRNMAASKGQSDKIRRKLGLAEIEDLALDFTIPGYDIELRPGGRDLSVTSANVEEYITEVIDAIIGRGAQLQAKAFREGFSKVFPIADLQAFTAYELVMLFGNSDEDWSLETLSEALKADHGFNADSRSIRNLIDIMSEYDAPTRRSYLQFITGSPKLPIGGFRGLNPPLTVVRKPHEAPLTADDYLPSVMTCVNYLKLPEYSSKTVMKEKLRVAMQEGVGSFHLS